MALSGALKMLQVQVLKSYISSKIQIQVLIFIPTAVDRKLT